MKGLLLKDFYMSVKYLKTFFFLIFVFSVTSVFSGDNLFTYIYPTVVASMLPVSLLGYDEKFRWNVYCDALPCSRAMVVSGKYLLSLILIIIVFLLSTVTQLIRCNINGSGIQELSTLMPVLLSLGLLCPALVMPAVFKLGAERGRIAYYVAIGFACALGVLIPSDLVTGWSLPMICVVPIAVVIFVLSWLLSIQLYKKRVL